MASSYGRIPPHQRLWSTNLEPNGRVMHLNFMQLVDYRQDSGTREMKLQSLEFIQIKWPAYWDCESSAVGSDFRVFLKWAEDIPSLSLEYNFSIMQNVHCPYLLIWYGEDFRPVYRFLQDSNRSRMWNSIKVSQPVKMHWRLGGCCNCSLGSTNPIRLGICDAEWAKKRFAAPPNGRNAKQDTQS